MATFSCIIMVKLGIFIFFFYKFSHHIIHIYVLSIIHGMRKMYLTKVYILTITIINRIDLSPQNALLYFDIGTALYAKVLKVNLII